MDVAPWTPTGSNASSLPPSSPPSACCPLPIRQLLQRRLCGLRGAKAGQSWLPWGSVFRENSRASSSYGVLPEEQDPPQTRPFPARPSQAEINSH